jgi:hypothetical protein
MKTTKKRAVLNEAFKQFQRLPQWPIEQEHNANQLSEKANDAKHRTVKPGSAGRASPLCKFQVLVKDAN